MGVDNIHKSLTLQQTQGTDSDVQSTNSARESGHKGVVAVPGRLQTLRREVSRIARFLTTAQDQGFMSN